MTVTPQNPHATAIGALKARIDGLNGSIAVRSDRNAQDRQRLDESDARVNEWRHEVADLEKTLAELESAEPTGPST